MSSPSPSTFSSPLSNSATVSLPPRKRARTDAEKEQRRVERIIRNRKAAHASREKKRKHVEQLESYVKLLEDNLSKVHQNQSVLYSKLKSSNTPNIKLISMISRPADLFLSDEDESSSNFNDLKKQKVKIEFKQDEEEVPEKQEDLDHETSDLGLDLNLDLSLDLNLDVKSKDPSNVVDSPLLSFSSSESSSPTISLSDLSNPTTPCKEINEGFSLFHNDVMDLNNYLEPEFSIPNEFIEVDRSLSLKTVEDNDYTMVYNNSMGYLGMYNSVHSAVMHIFSSSTNVLCLCFVSHYK